MTSRQAQGAISRLIDEGHLVKVREERRQRRGERQYTVYAVRGLVDPLQYDFRVRGSGSGRGQISSEFEGENACDSGVECEAVGEAVAENGEGEKTKKNQEFRALFEDKGIDTGKRFIDLELTSLTKTKNCCMSWATISPAEQIEVIKRVRTGVDMWARKAKSAPSKELMKQAGRRSEEFIRWYRALQRGGPDEQDQAYTEYLQSAID